MFDICLLKSQQMILKQYYEQKKATIETLLDEADLEDVRVRLHNEYIFTEDGSDDTDFPLVMFKYDHVKWNTSSEQEYKADVDFSLEIVFNRSVNRDFGEALDIAAIVDKAILEYPTKAQLDANPTLIPNSAFKNVEKQFVAKENYWDKAHHFIWCIEYRTTLIEQDNKKKYTLIDNDFFDGNVTINGNGDVTFTDQQQTSQALRQEGYALGDHVDLQTLTVKQKDGNDLLKVQAVDEETYLNLNINRRDPDDANEVTFENREQSILNSDAIAEDGPRELKKQ